MADLNLKMKLEAAVTAAPEVERLRSSFWRGFAFHMFLVMLIQDWMGLDRYIVTVQAEWRAHPFWLWGIFIAVVLAWQGLIERDHRRIVARLEEICHDVKGGAV